MTGKSKATSQARQPDQVFVNSNGRTYPPSNPKHFRSNIIKPKRSHKPTMHPVTGVGPIALTEQNSESTISAPDTDRNAHAPDTSSTIDSTNMASNKFRDQNPQIESSSAAIARAKHERQLLTPDISNNPTSVKRADSKVDVEISSTSKSASIAEGRNTPTSSANDSLAMYSNQTFDLGYKSRPASTHLYSGHTRVWNSRYTRPLEEILKEILEERYPVRNEAVTEIERAPLLLRNGSSSSDVGWNFCGLDLRRWVPRGRTFPVS